MAVLGIVKGPLLFIYC